MAFCLQNPVAGDCTYLKWDRTICLKDSDGDGLSNGQELGDPNCVWEPGSTPARTMELSHPGVCDPWNSPECLDKTKFVTCGPDRLQCPALQEQGIKNFTITLPKGTPVEARETIYKCMVFDYPQDTDYHLVANEPVIDNVDVMHHILVFGCEDTNTEHAPGVLYDCEMEADKNCKSIIGIWSFGMLGECAHEDMGFRIGKNGFKRGILQLHWNNPQERADFTDGSGISLYLTKTLRPYDAGILLVGQEHLVIPPGEASVSFKGTCSSECTQSLIKEEVKIPVVLNHMHALGASQTIELIRNGRKIKDISFDAKYDYNSPELHVHEIPLTLKPGDEIRTECVFNSMSRTRTTFVGEGTYYEMCYGFITYYPKENIPDQFCTAFKDVTICAFNISDVIHGCRFKELHDLKYSSFQATYDRVMQHCSPHIGCRKECLPVVRELKQSSCYRKGTIDTWARMNIENKSPQPHEMMKFYAALDSCDRELVIEEAEVKANARCPTVEGAEGRNDVRDGNGSTNLISSFILIPFLALIALVLLAQP